MKVVIVSGPTATGKTDMAVELARTFGGEVVNFDSLLLYKEVNIGTAKPTLEERKSVPHHLIDVRSISDPMNAADYAREARPVIENLLKKKTVVYLVGGSGFYLQALLKGMYDSPTTPLEITERSEILFEAEGIKPFLQILAEKDPESFHRYHENDHYRIRRAVEHWWANGTKLSDERLKKDSENVNLQETGAHNWDILHIHLDLPKDEHLQIITKRTKRMLASGLLEEAKNLLQEGFSGKEKPLQSIGYKEIFDYLNGIYKDLSECEERIIISTRQLAKSQRTWFKKDQSRKVFHPLHDREAIFNNVEDFLKGREVSPSLPKID
jgi:tRNA dimethylallyltransferase